MGDPAEGVPRSTAVFGSSIDERGRKRWVFGLGAIGLAVALTAVATLAPPGRAVPATGSVPPPDRVIVTVAPADPARREAAQRAAAGDLAAAVAVARADIGLARKTADPRYLGHAQAALAPWWTAAAPPDEVLILRATIRQSLHDFAGARADLDALVARRPDDGQALLTRAVVAGVVGDRAAAARDCAEVTRVLGELYGAACAAPLVAARGGGDAGRVRLTRAIAAARSSAAAAWAQTALAELDRQLGDDAAAELHFRTALAANPDDVYTLAALADLLLDAGRAAEVVTLLGDRAADNLALRRAIALARTGSPAAAAAATELRDRIAVSIARGDTLHLRERARFYLEVEHDADAAVAAARANWDLQREPADARVLLEAAAAARDRAAAAPVIAWLDAESIDDAILGRARRAVEAAR